MEEVTITLANRGGASFRVDRRKPLLDALEAQGMSLPYGCRYGGCISCAAKLRCPASDRLHIRRRRREP
jgi:ferredoxin